MSACILVVEDEVIIGRDIKRTLEGFGYVVPPLASSGAEALQRLREHRPDLVLMDIHIKGELDGIETAALIGKEHATPIVYLTSYSDDATLARAKMTGAYGYLLKPFQDRDLRTAIEVALQKRELERHLSERERWFATTLRSIGDAVIATDIDGRITFMNVVAERITGWKAAEALGKPIGEVMRLVDEKTGQPLVSPIEHALREGFSAELPAAVLSNLDGARRAITDSAAPIVDDAGKTLGGVVVFRDITERRHLEDRLARSERLAAIGTLSAGMSHEINNPLACVLANVSFALDQLREQRAEAAARSEPGLAKAAARSLEIADALADAHEAGARIHRIVQDLKKFGRLDRAEPTPLELNEVIESAVRMTENLVRHHARVRREYGTTPFVDASESQLGQVFINLLVNAAQAMGEGQVETKEIVVATRTDAAGRAVGEVRDTGPGIPPETLRRIFDPFFTTKPIGEGTGLGLSIAHSIVESIGGEITVESGVGKGTTFRVALPPAKRREAPRPADLPPAPARRGRVLVIDDEPSVGRALGRMLQREHDVFVVTDAEEALSRIASGEVFDVIFCDMMMPGLTGIEFCERLRVSDPELAGRIVFITGGVFTERTEEFLRTASNQTLAKPFDLVGVRRLIADLIAAPRGGPPALSPTTDRA